MKNIKNLILSTGFAAGLLAAAAGYGADTTTAQQPPPGEPNPPTQPPPAAPAPDEQNVPQPAQETTPPATNAPAAVAPAAPTKPAPTDTNAVSSVDSNGNIRFNFHGTPLDQILKFMSQSAGFIVVPNRNVDLSTRVTVWSDQPVSRDEALVLLKQVMADNGYQVEVDDRTLTIIPNTEARRSNIPVVLFKGEAAEIPKTADIMTYIIPVRFLNAVQLARDLQSLLPADSNVVANESGNSLIMTDKQMNIRRVVEIVKSLDAVSASSSTIKVFPLKYADAKTLAGLIKDLFPAADANAAGGRGNPFARMQRMFGGGGGGGDNGGNDTGNGHTPTTRVTAVADDRSNALAVAAPDDLIPTIVELVGQLDLNVEDLTVMRVFKLRNADPIETAEELKNFFADNTKTDDNNTSFGGRGFRFFGGPGGQQNNSTTQSDRTKKINQVTAVPDPRTGSVMVSAGKDLMPQIASMIEELDNDASGKMKVYVFDLQNADPTDVQSVLNDLFPSTTGRTGSSTTSTANAALATRNQTMQTQQNQATSTAFGSSGSGGRPSF